MLTRRCSLPSPQKVLTSLESAPLKVCNNAQFTENSAAYTVSAVHTHTLKRVPSQKCSLHYSVLTPIKVHSRTCSMHSAHCSPPEKCSPKVFTPVKSARPKVLTLRKLLSSKCSPFQKCSSHFAHPPKSALLKVLTPLKSALPKGLTLKKVLIP